MNAPSGQLGTRMFRATRRLRVLGMGLALPGPPISTDDLIARVESRFGVSIRARARFVAHRLRVEYRHLSRDLESVVEAPRHDDANADLSARAVRRALADAGLRVGSLGYLIGHTATPDTLLPPGVAGVADRLGYSGPFAEFRQACTGFANALVMAHGLLAERDAPPVAIVGSETGSMFLDPLRAAEDRGQLVNLLQMGDAAACIILAPDDGPGDSLDNFAFGCVGLDLPAGLSLCDGGSAHLTNRRPVPEFMHDVVAIRRSGPNLFLAGAAAARAFGIDLHSIDAVIPHQANGRLDEWISDLLQIPAAAVVTMARRVGNTGSAAIWAALAETRTRLPPGASAVALGAEATKYMFATFRFQKA